VSSHQGASAEETDTAADEPIKMDGKKKKRVVMVGSRQPAYFDPEHIDPSTGLMETPSSVIAAAPLIKKAVFCVDNVSLAATETDIKAYIEKLDVRVLTVHSTNARRTHRERRDAVAIKDLGRQAFRVCINKEDESKLMDPDNWPSSITVCEWFFKPLTDQQRLQRQQQRQQQQQLLQQQQLSAASGEQQLHKKIRPDNTLDAAAAVGSSSSCSSASAASSMAGIAMRRPSMDAEIVN